MIRSTLASTLALCCAVLLSAVLSGCVSTVAGTAVRGQSAGPIPTDMPQLTKSDLGRVLLSVGAVNGVMDATAMRVSASSEDMSDNSDRVSDLDCLGAVYGAEELVYHGSDWTAVRDEVLQEPSTDNDHWVEQVAVLYPSTEKARKFFDTSKAMLKRCGGTSIDVDNSESTSTWNVDEADVSGTVLTQTSTQRNADGWGCQHALTTAANLVTEAWACSYQITDEAKTLVTEMLKNAAKK